LTIFLCIIAWDTKRISSKKTECCGLCCCKEDTAICCHGRYLSNKQKQLSGLAKTGKDIKLDGKVVLKEYECKTPVSVKSIVSDSDDEPTKNLSALVGSEQNGDEGMDKEVAEKLGEKTDHDKLEVSGGIETFLRDKLAREMFTRQGKAVIISVYTIATLLCIYGVTQVEVDFKVTFFIKPGANVYNFLTNNEAYFASGFSPVFYVNNTDVDFTSEENQFRLL